MKAELCPREGLRKAFLRHRLEQVVDGIDFKCLDRVFVMRRDEHHSRHVLCANFLHNRESVHLRHLHIEKNEVWAGLADCGYRFASIPGFLNGGNFCIRGKPHAQALARQGLIINDQRCEAHGPPPLPVRSFRAQDDTAEAWLRWRPRARYFRR